MAIISDNPFDHEITKMKAFMEELKQTQNIFSAAFPTMRPREKADNIRKIQNGQRTVSLFLEKAAREEINNPGSRFAVENIKQGFQTLMHLWRKIEKNLENFQGGGTAVGIRIPTDESPTENAVQQYIETMKNLGQSPDIKAVDTFQKNLNAAYQKAQAQTGGKELEIKVIQQDGKIKVWMKPKG